MSKRKRRMRRGEGEAGKRRRGVTGSFEVGAEILIIVQHARIAAAMEVIVVTRPMMNDVK